jgi:excisionase family DNA binding protein
METPVTTSRIAWSIAEISEATGLSLGFLRNDVRRGVLRIKRFGRRVLVLDSDLRAYLNQGEETEEERLSA